MTVKDVICDALRLLGKEVIADAITQSVESGAEMSADVSRYVKLFTLIADSVTKELYSGYFPDAFKENLYGSRGVFDLSELTYPLVRVRKIVSLSSKRELTDYTLKNGILETLNGVTLIEITYEYTSRDYSSLGDNIADSKLYVTPEIIVTGMVAEYYCTIGDTVNAALWQERYENRIKLILDSGVYKPYSEQQNTLARSASLPRRRWV